jgi:small subunit ribosomal protein S17
MNEKARGKKKILTGIVVSDKMDKTVVVAVERKIKHPEYKKYIRTQSKFAAHDEGNQCESGDRVMIIESRPLSKTKRWRVMRIVEKQKLSE